MMVKNTQLCKAIGVVVMGIMLAGNYDCLTMAMTAKQGEESGRMNAEQKDKQIMMSYRIEGMYSPYKYISLSINAATGEGTVAYALYKEQVEAGFPAEGVVAVTIDNATIEKIIALHKQVNFFSIELDDENKDTERIRDVGTTTLTYQRYEQQRTISYGFVRHNPLIDLVEIYAGLAQQHLPF